MFRRRTLKLLAEYYLHYGPTRYGPRGWPAETEHLNVAGVAADIEKLRAAVQARTPLGWTQSAETIRATLPILEYCAASAQNEIQSINAEWGHIYSTHQYVSGRPGADLHRRWTVEGHVKQAGQLHSRLRSLAARYDRRATLQRLLPLGKTGS